MSSRQSVVYDVPAYSPVSPAFHPSKKLDLTPLPESLPKTSVVPRTKYKHSLCPRWVHLLILGVMMLGLMQTVRADISEVIKLTELLNYQPRLNAYYNQALYQQNVLKNKIHNATSSSSVEEMARDRLGYVGKNEVLVRFISQ